MSSSDESDHKPTIKSKSKSKSKTQNQDFQILPSKGGAQLDTSSWPLLLKVTIYFTYAYLEDRTTTN